MRWESLTVWECAISRTGTLALMASLQAFLTDPQASPPRPESAPDRLGEGDWSEMRSAQIASRS